MAKKHTQVAVDEHIAPHQIETNPTSTCHSNTFNISISSCGEYRDADCYTQHAWRMYLLCCSAVRLQIRERRWPSKCSRQSKGSGSTWWMAPIPCDFCLLFVTEGLPLIPAYLPLQTPERPSLLWTRSTATPNRTTLSNLIEHWQPGGLLE